MFIMEGRQKPLPAPHKHLLIARRRVGGGSGCYRLPCLSARHYCACFSFPELEAVLQQNPETHICSTNVCKAPTRGQALVDDSWPGFPRTNLFVEPSSRNAPLDPAELASSCLSTQPSSPCCLFQPLFPIAPLEIGNLPLAEAALWHLHISQVPTAPLSVGLLFITVTSLVPSDHETTDYTWRHNC